MGFVQTHNQHEKATELETAKTDEDVVDPANEAATELGDELRPHARGSTLATTPTVVGAGAGAGAADMGRERAGSGPAVELVPRAQG